MDINLLYSTKDTFIHKDYSQIWQLENLYHENYYQKPLIILNSTILKKLKPPNLIKNLHWTKDGNTLISINEDQCIRSYILNNDSDLLFPWRKYFNKNSIICYDLNPGFNYFDETAYELNLNNVLVSERELPIKLVNMNNNEIINNYKFLHKNQEDLLNSYSFKFLNENFFIAGSKNQFGIFDINRNDCLNNLDLKKNGIISTIEKNDKEIYFGSYGNKFSRFDLSSEKFIENKSFDNVNGIYQIIQSNNDNYICLLFRNSTKIPILDKRMGLEIIDYFNNDNSNNNQKCFGDVLNNNNGLILGNQFGELNVFRNFEIGIGGDPSLICKNDGTSIGSVKVNHEKSTEKKTIISFCQGSRIENDEDFDNYPVQIKVMELQNI